MPKASAINDSPRVSLVRAARLHYLLAAIAIVQIMIYDAWKLIVPEAVLVRWMAIAMFVAIVTIIWYRARSTSPGTIHIKRLIFALIVADIALASFFVYVQRGMASRSVTLYIVPLLVAGILGSRRAIYATATLSVVAYTTTAVSYFVLNFNEGYKIELYGELAFYCAIIFLIAGLLWNFLRKAKSLT